MRTTVPNVETLASDADETADEDLERITTEEERVLARVLKHVASREMRAHVPSGIDYDAELLALRDQINEARLEDVPPLIEEMERLHEVAVRRAKVTEGAIDPRSPYFGRMVLEEDDRKREVLIGRSTYLDAKTGIRIVDWRDAPVSRLYYRYEEGDEYDEEFGGREVHGDVLVRRNLTIGNGVLRRIGCPQGTFMRRNDGTWRRAGESARKLAGGQGAAMRAEGHHRPGRLGVGRDGDGRDDRFLPEITALIDPRQFELISAADSGLVVIQGGAGSGKTTIGLHRLAYLNFQDHRRFKPERMLVMVFNEALKRYISRVLPALGVDGVPVTTYEKWAHRLRREQIRHLPDEHEEDTPSSVTRFKKHPKMLELIERQVALLEGRIEAIVRDSVKGVDGGERAVAQWTRWSGVPLAQRLEALSRWSAPKSKQTGEPDLGSAMPLAMRHAVDRAVARGKELAYDVASAWSEMLTDKGAIEALFAGELTETDLRAAIAWCARRCPEIVHERDERVQTERESAGKGDRGRRGNKTREEEEQAEAVEERDEMSEGIDGVDEKQSHALDHEDDTILLRLMQRMWGPLTKGRERLSYEHILVDEAQDLSPVELAVVLDTATDARSVTLAGDIAQRLMMDNGFTNWNDVLGRLGMSHVQIEPLRITYRSTAEIIEFAKDVLGPLRNEEENTATRHGAPVELFELGSAGEGVAFLGEALRDLMSHEPRASVAVIARYPEQADLYYEGLKRAEVPFLRRIAEQDFPFRAGVDVTDVRQVKGLEFDYVVLLEVGTSTYPEDDESRHLLHIAATRAAHQLWVSCSGEPSSLIPKSVREA